MKIAGTSTLGLWKFKDGITYEKDDILYYKGMLYVVTSGTYNGDEVPSESVKCTSFIEYLSDYNKLVTASNLAGIIHKILNGVQLGGTISRIEINNESQLNRYTNNGIYSVRMKIGTANFNQHAFESILKVYRFKVGNEDRIVQEIIDYADLRTEGTDDHYPAVIWVRMCTIRNDIPVWSGFNPIVSAYDNTEYGEWLTKLVAANETIKSQASELLTKMKAAAYYEISRVGNAYHISRDNNRSTLFSVVYKYTSSGNTYIDNFTYEPSAGSGKCLSQAGREVTVSVNANDDAEYIVTFSGLPSGATVLRVINIGE